MEGLLGIKDYSFDRKSINRVNCDDEYKKKLLKPITDAQNSVNKSNKDTFLRLLEYLLPYRRDVMIGAILATIISLVPASLSGRFIDEVINQFQDGRIGLIEAKEIGFVFILTLGITYILREFFIWLRLSKMSILGENVARDLRAKLFNHLQHLSMDFYSKNSTGSIVSRITGDTDRIWDFIAFGVIEVGISIIYLVGLATMLIYLDVKLRLTLAIPVPFFLLVISIHSRKMQEKFIRAWRKWANVTNLLSDSISGIQVIKAFNQKVIISYLKLYNFVFEVIDVIQILEEVDLRFYKVKTTQGVRFFHIKKGGIPYDNK